MISFEKVNATIVIVQGLTIKHSAHNLKKDLFILLSFCISQIMKKKNLKNPTKFPNDKRI